MKNLKTPLDEWSEEDLIEVLRENQNHDSQTLAYVCSEILRRQFYLKRVCRHYPDLRMYQ
jgi:hypothetical protein